MIAVRRHSLTAEHRLPKPRARVRFPLPAPMLTDKALAYERVSEEGGESRYTYQVLATGRWDASGQHSDRVVETCEDHDRRSL